MSDYVIISVETVLRLQVVNFTMILGGAYMKKVTYDENILTKEALQSLRSQGVTYAKMAEHFGVTEYTVKRAMMDYGLLARKPGKKFLDVSPKYVEARAEEFQKFLALHKQGLTFTQIASECGRSLAYVGRLFTLNGYSFDSNSKTKAAHDAVRGMKRTIEDLEKRAIGKEKTPPKMSRWESWFAEWLTSQGIEFTFNKAFGKYNFDFAIGDSVAVELYGGAFHSDGRAAARLHDRMTYILNRGWNVYIIWCLSKEETIFPGCLDDFLIFLKHTRRDETFRGKYRVIWSDGDLVSFGGYESDYRAVVFPARMRHNALSKYKSPRD